MTVEFVRQQVVIDGRPTLVIAGEVHYFRLERSEWRRRLEQLAAAGANAVATYIPWLVHELPDGTIDVEGTSAEWRDVGAFLDTAREVGLYAIPRPGPFIMAELKNEGIPYRLYGIEGTRARSWGGAENPTRTLDYSSPEFLAEVEGWFAAIVPVLSARHIDRGGNVIAVQLDNEIGMLSWVSNSPDLSPAVAREFAAWLASQYGTAELAERYPLLPLDPAAAAAHLQRGGGGAGGASDPASEHRLALDLARFSRHRFRAYSRVLVGLAEKHGCTGLPFLINIHGTSAGRGRTYPIGISQLLGTWAGEESILAGSDMYLGELTTGNLPDFVTGNLFAHATQPANQPLAALEFETGSSDYGEDLANQTSPNATDLKTRLAVALGNRMLNYYLFAGGRNKPLEAPVGDGNNRVAFTGERHGFAAPLTPEGETTPHYFAIQDAARTLRAYERWICTSRPRRTGLSLGFIPDQYLTEYLVPGDDYGKKIREDHERYRGMGPRDILARAMSLSSLDFNAVNLSSLSELGAANPAGEIPESTTTLMVASGHYMAADVQSRLGEFVLSGGKLLVAGVLPTHDLDGAPCTALSDALGIGISGEVGAHRIDGFGMTTDYYPSVKIVDGTGLPSRAEVRVGSAQLYDAEGSTTLLREVQTGEPCAVEVAVGRGRAIVWGADYPCDLEVHRELFRRLDATARVHFSESAPGLIAYTQVSDADQSELLNIFNLASYPVTTTVAVDEQPAFGGAKIRLPARSGLLLGRNLDLGNGRRLLWSSAELVGTSAAELTFRLHDGDNLACLEQDGVRSIVELDAQAGSRPLEDRSRFATIQLPVQERKH
ncbi:beta-galactosidase [Arthrobacter bambusae]|uniref:beta-galactosidase n=1 Tax=Arthrobacter TaxID=1663 RepID=UPI001F514F87|nr:MULTISPECIES: beta-galactosidase [Arthrobacter]MCI0141276.1 beta-galactosidase [Arthrobacter bambusae]UYY82129.1 beta-galactosidase [Arthrobacter sp. YA7-1]